MSKRLISDAHGAPDDSDVLKQAGMFRIDDMAELAVRLGSPVDYNKYGDVIFWDDFESGLVKPISAATGVGGYVRISGAGAKSKGCSVVMCSGTGADPTVMLGYILHYPLLVSTGLKVSFALGTDVYRCSFGIILEDGTGLTQFELRYEVAGDDLYIISAGGVYQLIDGSLDLYQSPKCHHDLKLIGDYNLSNYVSLFIDHLEYDLTAYPGYSVAGAMQPCLVIQAICEGDGITPAYLYLDNLVVTQHDLVTGM